VLRESRKKIQIENRVLSYII